MDADKKPATDFIFSVTRCCPIIYGRNSDHRAEVSRTCEVDRTGVTTTIKARHFSACGRLNEYPILLWFRGVAQLIRSINAGPNPMIALAVALKSSKALHQHLLVYIEQQQSQSKSSTLLSK